MPEDPTDAAEPKPTVPAPELFTRVPDGISAWVGALQLTVLFAAAGFIGKVSLQEFLGIDLGNWTATDLSLFAGHWAFETLGVVLNEILGHPIRFGVPFLLYLTPLMLPYLLPPANKLRRTATLASIGLVTLTLLTVLVRYEVPTLGMKGWLTTPLRLQLDQPGTDMLSERRGDMQATLFVSKMSAISNLATRDLSKVVCSVSPDEIDTLHKHMETDHPAAAATETLKTIYAYTVLICIAAWVAIYFHAAIDGPGAVNEAFRAVRLFVCLLLLPTVTALIPYMYAKVIYATDFSLVAVDYKADSAAAKRDDASGVLPGAQFLVMDETDKDISLLVTNNQDIPDVEIRGRDEIGQITRYGTRDVINFIIRNPCD